MSAQGESLEFKRGFGGRTVLSPQAVEVTRGGQTQRYAKNVIRGFRTGRARYVTVFTLEILNEAKPIKFNVPHRQEGAVRAMLEGAPDLDALDLRAAEEAIRKDDAFGSSPDERWQTLQSEKRTTLILNCVMAAIAAWGLIFPRPYEVSVIACAGGAVAAVALSFVKRGRWYLIPRRNDPHPSLMIGLLSLVAAVALRALIDLSLLDWAVFLAASCAIGIALTVCVLAMFGELKLSRWPAVLLGVAFACGVVAQADARLDTSVPQIFEPKIVSMYVSHGRSTSYHVTLSAWGPETGDNAHDVPEELFNQLSIQSSACVSIYPGALRMRWYVITPACSSGVSNANPEASTASK
ncbi:MAG: hypothetical protein HY054_07950 [Proteobacteria bacterium]|nr:hypothetical protein [Pseudomonadota bacterium]